MASFDAEHQHLGYNDSQISSGYGNLTLTTPASGPDLGISQPDSAGNSFGFSAEIKADHAFPPNPYLDQAVAPTFGTATGSSDLGDPYALSFGMNDLFNENFLEPIHGNDCDG